MRTRTRSLACLLALTLVASCTDKNAPPTMSDADKLSVLTIWKNREAAHAEVGDAKERVAAAQKAVTDAVQTYGALAQMLDEKYKALQKKYGCPDCTIDANGNWVRPSKPSAPAPVSAPAR